jgi:pyridoxine 4-dehydrogenase
MGNPDRLRREVTAVKTDSRAHERAVYPEATLRGRTIICPLANGMEMAPEISAAHAGSVRLGDRSVHRLGLGTNRIADTESARAVLRRAVELGVNFIDTADIYQSTVSETTIGKTLGGRTPDVVVATKGGMLRDPNSRGVDGHPDYLRRAVDASLRRLGVDCIELYQLHRVDPEVPIETSVGALKEMQEAGKVRRIGLSNVTVEEVERARRVASIVSVQNQYNVLQREQEPVLRYCEEHSIVFIPWTPVSRGKLASSKTLAQTARRLGVTPYQVALRWLLQRSPMMLPIPGTLSIAHLEENLRAADIELSREDLERLKQ